MPASYPTSLKTYTTKADGETIFGAHMNEVQEEIVAIQTILGTAPQGGSATVKARILAVETGKSDTSHNHDHNALTNLTTGDPHTQYMLKALGTTKGDVIAYTGSGVPARVAVGTNGFAVIADSAQSAGVRYGDHGDLAGRTDDDHTIYQIADILPFYSEGTLSVKTGTARFRWPYAVTILGISASVATPPTGASVIADVNKATAAVPATLTTIYTTQGNRPTVAASAYGGAETVPDTTAFAAGDFMTVDIDQVGSTVAGDTLGLFVRYRRT
jgi:hypothetical protein